MLLHLTHFISEVWTLLLYFCRQNQLSSPWKALIHGYTHTFCTILTCRLQRWSKIMCIIIPINSHMSGPRSWVRHLTSTCPAAVIQFGYEGLQNFWKVIQIFHKNTHTHIHRHIHRRLSWWQMCCGAAHCVAVVTSIPSIWQWLGRTHIMLLDPCSAV